MFDFYFYFVCGDNYCPLYLMLTCLIIHSTSSHIQRSEIINKIIPMWMTWRINRWTTTRTGKWNNDKQWKKKEDNNLIKAQRNSIQFKTKNGQVTK